MPLKITCLGGVGQVTGSCYLIEKSGKKYLVDCGLFQGGKKVEMLNTEPWPFSPPEIEALFLTHAHIDHSGRIPKLVKDGFRGRIYASHPTVALCRILFLDAAHIQEMQAEWKSRKNARKGLPPVEPLYTQKDAEEAFNLLVPIDRDEEIRISENITVTFRNAGHILGSSFLELKTKSAQHTDGEMVILFSGDIGRPGQLIVKDPATPHKADVLFIESTYGNRDHKSLEESRQELIDAIRYSYQHGEKVLIPAFAVERTQEVLYLLGEFFRNGEIPDMPVYLDSPLAIEATKIFREMKSSYDEKTMEIVKAGHDPFDFPQLRLTPAVDDSRAINMSSGPAVVIAGNGMCTAGRILHHIKHNIWRPGCSIVFVGYQAEGSIGRRIIEGARNIRVLGEEVAVRARVFTIGGLSSHAGQSDLLEWVSAFYKPQMRVFVVHGEKTSSTAFAELLRSKLGLNPVVPQRGDVFILEPETLGEAASLTCETYMHQLSRRFLDIQFDLFKRIPSMTDDEKILLKTKLEKLEKTLEELAAAV
ncbi:MBL fold metallo-hydrolase RNA specificity domain-containing protein [Thermodesulforhabdus norvegica]|uniref:Metallo-beta-lactamase family protein n=1 Tax=Thermodesulforhabdus norvegica TaxID=39841 RepID=A0A1I4UQ25_9BACT|nr:MBL fold metallo-hydrolase [Thermodesulforhabdus norvegica]SFM91064.1 metallo-beta-lactamase family protein [Thermodesulforhabdus norvegica]